MQSGILAAKDQYAHDPANVSGPRPGANPLRLAGYSLIISRGLRGGLTR